MGKKTTNQAPPWAVEDNPYSKWARLYVDILKSSAFQALSKPAQMFYFVCLANMHDDKARASLKNHIMETHESIEAAGRLYNLDIDKYLDSKNGYFIMPAKHLKQYGYTRGNGWKLMNELIDAGFVEKVEANKHRKKENVYRFSTAWKRK